MSGKNLNERIKRWKMNEEQSYWLGHPIGEVIRQDLCVGCGVCTGLCPASCLEMRLNPFGEYRPFPTGNQCKACMLCLMACPFAPDNVPNEDDLGTQLFSAYAGMNYLSELGYYLSCHVGYVTANDLRWSRTSGGLASWLLATLLQKGLVDAVYCVVETESTSRRFLYTRVTNIEQIWQASKSAYYPVELSDVLKELRQTPGKVALVALPCVIKGLRKASLYVPDLQKRVTFIAGLVCGQNKSALFCDYLIRLTGQVEENVGHVSFREKVHGNPAWRYAFAAKESEVTAPPKLLYWDQGYGRAWIQDYFKLNACNFCDDLFSELADISFMDAWLPPYNTDPQGTNFVIVRCPDLQRLLLEGVELGMIHLEPISADLVIASQRYGLYAKRRLLAVRLRFAQGKPGWRWVKRVSPATHVGLRERLAVYASTIAMTVSKSAFLEQKNLGPGLAHFERRMRHALWWYNLCMKAFAVLDYLPRLVRKIRAFLKSSRRLDDETRKKCTD